MRLTLFAVFHVLLAATLMAAVGASEPGSDAPVPARSTPQVEPPSEQDTWLFSYFRQRYDSRVEIDAQGHPYNVPLPDPMRVEQLHLALSTDGRHWTPLNGGLPVWGQRLRDPFLQRGPDGVWRLLASGRGSPRTTAAGDHDAGPVCLCATSRDLFTWEEVRSLPLMQGVRDETDRPARNIWAPTWFFDARTQEYVLLWSSSFEDAGWKKSRLWCARTRDWQSFTPAQELLAPGYSAIDGTLLEQKGTYFLFHKEEEFAAATGERRAIRVATSNHLQGPYQVQEGPLNRGQLTPTITEGPSVMADPLRPGGFLLLYDYCMTNRFGLSSSPDLLNWRVEEAVSFPPDARHGSVARLSVMEAARLRAAFPVAIEASEKVSVGEPTLPRTPGTKPLAVSHR